MRKNKKIRGLCLLTTASIMFGVFAVPSIVRADYITEGQMKVYEHNQAVMDYNIQQSYKAQEEKEAQEKWAREQAIKQQEAYRKYYEEEARKKWEAEEAQRQWYNDYYKNYYNNYNNYYNNYYNTNWNNNGWYNGKTVWYGQQCAIYNSVEMSDGATCYINPGWGYSFNSTNSDVASVDNKGVVTAKNKGECTIIIRSIDAKYTLFTNIKVK